MIEDTHEFQIASSRGAPRRVAIDMTTVTTVEELKPKDEIDHAGCLVFTEKADEPFRIFESYDLVYRKWKAAGVRTEAA